MELKNQIAVLNVHLRDTCFLLLEKIFSWDYFDLNTTDIFCLIYVSLLFFI